MSQESSNAANLLLQEGEVSAQSANFTRNSPPAAKIALFRSLFRGREDVYPRRFESRRTGKSGYAPACGNEWIRGICEKPRVNARSAQTVASCRSPMK